MKIKLILLTGLLLGLANSTLAADVAAGKAKAAVCAGCHGPEGKAMIPTYPSLAGQNAAYLELSLKAYKNKQRTNPQAAVMTGMATGLSDADIANLAAYFSSLK